LTPYSLDTESMGGSRLRLTIPFYHFQQILKESQTMKSIIIGTCSLVKIYGRFRGTSLTSTKLQRITFQSSSLFMVITMRTSTLTSQTKLLVTYFATTGWQKM
jgi:hypothetical protein